jgi:hypothetical protein
MLRGPTVVMRVSVTPGRRTLVVSAIGLAERVHGEPGEKDASLR